MGASLPPDLIAILAGPLAPGQYAEVGAPAELAPIGRVTTADGTVTATRADGTVVTLAVDSLVYAGDVLETGADSAVALIFNDDAIFAMEEDSKMVLDNMVYDPTSGEGSSTFSVVRGIFSLVSGQISANDPDAMIVRTPGATLAVRGTTIAGEAGEQTSTFVLLADPDGSVGSFIVITSGGFVVVDQSFQSALVSSPSLAPTTEFFTESQVFDTFGDVLDTLAVNDDNGEEDLGDSLVADALGDIATAAGDEGTDTTSTIQVVGAFAFAGLDLPDALTAILVEAVVDTEIDSGDFGDDRSTIVVVDGEQDGEAESPTVFIFGTNGFDTIDVSAGSASHQIDGSGKADKITGGSGNDVIIGGAGRDTLIGGGGDDTFLVGLDDGFDEILGGEGNDRILATADGVTIGLGEYVNGVEVISADGNVGVTISGGDGFDTLDFSTTTLTGIEAISGGIDNDNITGSAGDDVIIGGAGRDNLSGGDGNDTFLVGLDDGFDEILGGEGNDRILATADGVTIGLGEYVNGVEVISADGNVGVTISGGDGFDTLDFSTTTLTGIEAISGGIDNDNITGSAGDDTINGDAGRDSLSGGDGNDVLRGGTGNDDLDGGTGANTYLYGAIDEAAAILENVAAPLNAGDRIFGFDGDDVIQLFAGEFFSAATEIIDGVNFFAIDAAYDGTNSGAAPDSGAILVFDTAGFLSFDADPNLTPGAEGYSVIGQFGADTTVTAGLIDIPGALA